MKQNGDSLQHAPHEYEARQGIVLEAVENKCHALKQKAPEHKADCEIVLEAEIVLDIAKQKVKPLQYDAPEHKADCRIVPEAEIVLESVNRFSRSVVLRSYSKQ